ncbi:MAG: hypothetical protein K2P80_02860 [Beijerinckiaceae bacterium]|nr:hypothetical protein [Beijerinckiaceae bacterium]
MTDAPPSDGPWYWGTCVSNTGVSAIFEVTHQKKGSIYEPIDKPRQLFPRQGQADVHGPESKDIGVGDSYVFRVKAHDRPGASTKMRLSARKRTLRFGDASEASDLGAALAGLAGQSGSESLILRIWPDAIVKISREHTGLRDDEIKGLPLHVFEPSCVVEIARGNARIAYYQGEITPVVSPERYQSDASFVRSVIRALPQAAANDAQVSAVIGWLDQRASELRGKLSIIEDPDATIHDEILRSERLVAILRRERSIIADYVSMMKKTPSVQDIVRRELERAIAVEKDEVLAGLRATALAALDVEMDAKRHEAQLEMDMISKDLRASAMEETEAACRTRVKEAEERIGVAEAAGRKALDELKSDADSVRQAISVAQNERRIIEAEVNSMRGRRSEMVVEIEQLGNIVKKSTAIGDTDVDQIIPMGFRIDAIPADQRTVGLGAWAALMSGRPTLNASGRNALMRFTSLLMAGEVPALYGGQVDDFLQIASNAIVAGRMVTMYADPTIITGEDIWVRPSGIVKTPFGQCMSALTRHADAPPVIGVVRNADRSGLRFWLPALMDSALHGPSPSRFMPVICLADHEGEEATIACRDTLVLNVDDVLDERAAMLHFDEGEPMILSPDVIRRTPADEIQLIVGQLIRSPSLARRIAGVAAIAREIMSDQDATAFLEEFASAISPITKGADQ